MDEDYGDVISAALPTPAPKLTRTVRGAEKLKGVQPDLVNHWNNLQTEFSKAGLSPAIKSGFRTAEQQNSLHRRGYPTKGNDGYINISPHQEGRALDISFSAAQKPKGREIIASYAKANGLHVPSDEPWHIAIPKTLQAQDDYADIVGAAVPKAKVQTFQPNDSYDDVIAAAAPKGKQPSITEALDRLDADVNKRTAGIKIPKPTHEGQPRSPANDLSSDEIRVMKGEQPVNREAFMRGQRYSAPSPQREAEERLGAMQTRDAQVAQERAIKDKPEIDRLAAKYRKAIRTAAPVVGTNLVTETGARGASQWGELAAGLLKTGEGALGGVAPLAALITKGISPETVHLHSAALQQAAEEEGANRNDATKFAQNLVGGLIGSAPEMAAMSAGIPAPLVFGAGSGLRAHGSGKPVIPAATHGVLTGAAFDLPVEGALAKAATVGTATGGLDLAVGASPTEALKSGLTNAAMVGLPHLLKGGVPESADTLSAQLESRGYTLVPEGTQKPSLPRGTRAEKTADGVVYYDPKRIDAKTIRNTPTTELLGHIEPKSETTTETVVARTPEGTEIQSSAVSPENVEKQAQVMQEQYPAAKIETGGNELAEKVIAERVEPQRFQHLQFGEVEVLPDQTGAGNGRLKVAEVADSGKVHYVKKADLQGRGNSQMIPLKSEPQNVSTAPPLQPETAEQNRARIEDAKSQLSELSATRGEPNAAVTPTEGESTKVGLSEDAGGGQSEKIPPVSSTAPKDAAMQADREALGLPELERLPSVKAEEVLIKAKEANTEDPHRPDVLVAQALEGGKNFNNIETMQVNLRAQEIKNRHAEVMKEIADAKDPETIAEKRIEADRLEGEFDRTSEAQDKAGAEWSKAGRARQRAINEDFELLPMKARAKKTLGRDLSAEENATIEKLHSRIAELEADAADHQEKVRNGEYSRAVERIKRDVAKETRKMERGSKKQSLDDEAAELKNLIAQAWKKQSRPTEGVNPLFGLGKFDPEGEITKLVLKLARNRVKKGTITAAGLADEIHGLLKDVIDIEPRQVREMISGYGRKVQPRSELQKQLDALKSELYQGLGQEDVEAGKRSLRREGPSRREQYGAKEGPRPSDVNKLPMEGPRTSDARKVPLQGPRQSEARQSGQPLQGPKLSDIRKVPEQGPRLSEGVGRKAGPRIEDAPFVGARLSDVRQLPAEGPKITDAPKVGPREYWPARKKAIEKQIAELERKAAAEEFGPKAKRGQTVYHAEGQRLQEELGRAKLNYERKLRNWEQEKRGKAEKLADLVVKWGRAAKLSYVSTLGKLSSAASGRMVMSPIENLVGEIPHRLLPELSKKATTEGGGFSKAAEVAALWKSGRFRQVLNQITKGSSNLDVELGPKSKMLDKEMSSGGVLGIPGRVHGALKEYPRQAEFDRAFTKTLRSYEQQGKDITEPGVQLAARMEAFNSAERARFQQRNFISDTFNDAMSGLERKGMAGKAASKVGRFIFPITRVPVNVVGETLNYTLGVPRAAIETAIRGGVKNLTPEQSNNIMRAYKKGGIGLAVMTYAFLNPQQFGGYYQQHDKRSDKEPQAGEIMFFGHRIPKVLTHIPILEAAQLAATARRVMDKLAQKGQSKTEALEGGTLAVGEGLAEQIPFYETPFRFAEAAKGGKEAVERLAGQQAKGMIPGFIQEGARLMDRSNGEPTRRRRMGAIQEIQEGIPGLRQKLPISDVFGSQKTKASDEIQRLKIDMKGAVRQPEETPEEFKTRQAVQNGNIRTQLENIVALPDYDKASDEDKARWLKQGAEFATQETKESLPEKPEKKEEKQFPMPRASVGFESTYPAAALDRFERMNANQRAAVRDSMAQKAWILTHSTALSDEEKAAYKERLDALGVTPRPAGERPRTTTFRQQLTAQ